MSHRERTSWHEAGHAIVGRELGVPVEYVEVDVGEGHGGVCASDHYRLSLPDELAYLLSGRMAVALAEHDDPEAARWWEASAGNTLDLERGWSPGKGTGMRFWDWARIAGGETRLNEELEAASRQAVAILRDREREVADLATRLFNEGRVDLRGRGYRSRRAAGPTPSVAELKRQSRESLNQARSALGLAPRKPVGGRRLSQNDPIVLAIKARLKQREAGQVWNFR